MFAGREKELREFFRQMEEKRIFYFLLSNFEDFDDSHGDIDIFVSPQDKVSFLFLLERNGWLERREPPNLFFHNFFYKIMDDCLICLDVRFELSFGLSEKSFWQLKNEERVINSIVRNNGSGYRPKGLGAILLYLIHIIEEKKITEERHFRKLEKYLDIYGREIDKREEDEFKKVKNLIKRRDWGKIITEYFKKRKDEVFDKDKKRRSGLGFCLLFLGTNGSGKTTLINQITKSLNFKISKLYLGQKDWALKFVGGLYSKGGDIPVLNLLNIYFFYPLDLLLRVFRVRRFSKFRLVLIDRIPGFAFLGNKIILSIYKVVMPKIDLFILLDGSPEKIWERKKEHSLEKVKADMLKWRKVADRLPSPKLIVDTTSNSPEESAAIVIREIFKSDIFLSRLFKPIDIKE